MMNPEIDARLNDAISAGREALATCGAEFVSVADYAYSVAVFIQAMGVQSASWQGCSSAYVQNRLLEIAGVQALNETA